MDHVGQGEVAVMHRGGVDFKNKNRFAVLGVRCPGERASAMGATKDGKSDRINLEKPEEGVAEEIFAPGGVRAPGSHQDTAGREIKVIRILNQRDELGHTTEGWITDQIAAFQKVDLLQGVSRGVIEQGGQSI